MKTNIVLLALLGSATCATAQEAVKSETKPVTNQEVNAVCTEITGKKTGHPVRDCMSSIDMFLSDHNVPRKEP